MLIINKCRLNTVKGHNFLPDVHPRINYLSPKDKTGLRGALILLSAKSRGGGWEMQAGLLWEAERQAGCSVCRERHGGPGSPQPRTLLALAGGS